MNCRRPELEQAVNLILQFQNLPSSSSQNNSSLAEAKECLYRQWLIDQVVRILIKTETAYDKFVQDSACEEYTASGDIVDIQWPVGIKPPAERMVIQQESLVRLHWTCSCAAATTVSEDETKELTMEDLDKTELSLSTTTTTPPQTNTVSCQSIVSAILIKVLDSSFLDQKWLQEILDTILQLSNPNPAISK